MTSPQRDQSVEITDAMVERAARILWEHDQREMDYSWEPNKAHYLALAREALSAALGPEER